MRPYIRPKNYFYMYIELLYCKKIPFRKTVLLFLNKASRHKEDSFAISRLKFMYRMEIPGK